MLEMQPASYTILAANEAEKTAEIKIVDYRMIGATGRLYLSGKNRMCEWVPPRLKRRFGPGSVNYGTRYRRR